MERHRNQFGGIGVHRNLTGWWRERLGQHRYNSNARYSLIVTIATDDTEIELYEAVMQEIRVPVEIDTVVDPDAT